jgi:hypothetical protein
MRSACQHGVARALALVLLLVAGVARAQPAPAEAPPAPGAAPACGEASGPARIHVQFEDRAITRDNRRTVEELTRMSGGVRGSYHSVMGLTVAEPSARLQWAAPALAQPAGGGGVCASAAFTLTLGFTTMEVYLARELTDACRRAIVDEHELEHVGAWRQHLRAGGRLMEGALRAQLGQPAWFASPEAAQTALRAQAEAVVGNLLPRLREGVMAAHGTIDSPQSYQFTERRMRACP